jgi:hypothetical protein
LDSDDLAKIEEALNTVLKHGWGTVEIQIARGQVSGFKFSIEEKLKSFSGE